MKRLIKKILMEDRRQMYLDRIIEVMKNDFPLFKNMELYGFTEQLSSDEYNYVLSGIFGEPVEKSGTYIYNDNGNEIYSEDSNGSWEKLEFDENGNIIYREYSKGNWEKKEYDNNGNRIYYENSNGDWIKHEYDDNGNRIYYEDSNGFWKKSVYDDNGKQIYIEYSDGEIYDYR